MKTLYLDCGMGAAGDMLTAALLELVPDPIAVLKELNAAGIPGVQYGMETAVKCGITGKRVRVSVNGVMEEEPHHHHHEHDYSHDHEHEHDHHDHTHDGEHHHDHIHHSMKDVEGIIRGLCIWGAVLRVSGKIWDGFRILLMVEAVMKPT